AVSPTTGALDGSFVPKMTAPDPAAVVAGVSSLLLSGSTLYVGGRFNKIGTGAIAGLPIHYNLPALSATDGSALARQPDPGGRGDARALGGATREAGGDVRFLGGTPRADLAARNLADGSLDPSFHPPITSSLGGITALLLSGSTLYAGGEFAAAGSTDGK